MLNRSVIILVSVFTLFIASGVQSVSAATDSVYVKIIECYVPRAAFSRFSASNMANVLNGQQQGEEYKKLVEKACTTVLKTYDPEAELKKRLAAKFKDQFNVEEATLILRSCADGEGFADKALYDRVDGFMDGFNPLLDHEISIVWLRYIGKVTVQLADLVEATPVTK